MIEFVLDGVPVGVPDRGDTLLGALREDLGVTSAKDGCSPQGQCGCCTVWVDGAPRVSCVTPAARVAGRTVTTLDGLDTAAQWADAFVSTGASQCGFCTPGIIMRLAALQPGQLCEPHSVKRALLAHLCRCTGWNTIVEAAEVVGGCRTVPSDERDFAAAARRARLEGHQDQRVGPEVALGAAGFAADGAPPATPVAVRSADGQWLVGSTPDEVRRAGGFVQGRRTTAPVSWPIEPADVDGVAVTLQTTWVEPAYLETDASWCQPGHAPSTALANGGAFGGKTGGAVESMASDFAGQLDSAVRVHWTREDVVRHGPKRPPVAISMRADGAGLMRIAAPTGDDAALIANAEARIIEGVAAVAPDLAVEFVPVSGLSVSSTLRAAGWAEAAVAKAALGDTPDCVVAPNGATATAEIVDVAGNETVRVTVSCGAVLDSVVLRSYCIGAAHMALGWVRSEAIAVDELGVPHDLTIRSFGILRAADTPAIEVELVDDGGEPVNGSDAVFAAVAAAAWRVAAHSPRWPTGLQSGT